MKEKQKLKGIGNRGQVSALSPQIIGLVVAIIILVLGLVIIQELRDTDVVKVGLTTSVVDEDLITVTELGEELAGGSAPAGACSISTIVNATDNVLITSPNYTISNCRVSYNAATGTVKFNNTNWEVNYSYTQGDESYVAANTSLVGLGNFSDFVPLIVLAVASSVVIGLIIGGFAFRRRIR